MAFNGSGTFVRLYNWVNDAAANIKIRADRMDNEMNGMATALSTCITKDGQTTVTANLPMAEFRHTGVGAGAARTDYARLDQAQDGKLAWVDGGGTADAITASYAIPITALVDGQLCYVRATAANATTTPTFSPSALTARTIVKNGGAALAAGDISGVGHELILRYNLANTRWELLNPKTTIPTQILNNFAGAGAPTVNDDSGDGYSVGSRWTYVASGITYECVDATLGAAIWQERVGLFLVQNLQNKTAPTPSSGDNSTKLATTAYVDAATSTKINTSAITRTSSTTPTNIPGLTWTLGAGTYVFDFAGQITCGTTGGFAINFATTGSATGKMMRLIARDTTTLLNIATGTSPFTTATYGTTGVTVPIVSGSAVMVLTGTETITLQLAQAVSNGTSTVIADGQFHVTVKKV